MTISILARVDPARSHVEARTEDDRPVAMDGEPPDGTGDLPGPKETLLAALAGCTAIDVGSILRKKRQAVESYEIVVSGDTAAEHPKVFTEIRVDHRVSGRVEAEPLRRAIELSATRYCPVSAMLSQAARIEHSYRLTDATGATSEALVAVTGPDGRRRVL